MALWKPYSLEWLKFGCCIVKAASCAKKKKSKQQEMLKSNLSRLDGERSFKP